MELQVFTYLEAGELPPEIARKVGCSVRQVYRFRRLGRPRWRHKAHGELHPSPAVIRWHCDQFKTQWSAEEELRRRVQKPVKFEVSSIPASVLGLVDDTSISQLQEESW